MESVGIREFKAHLSRHLRAVRAGSRLAITDRGHVVAEVGPPAGLAQSELDRQIVAVGGTLANGRADLGVAGPKAADWQPVDVRGLIDELRGDR